VILDESYPTGSSLSYFCNDGFGTRDPIETVCQAGSLTWTLDSNLPSCILGMLFSTTRFGYCYVLIVILFSKHRRLILANAILERRLIYLDHIKLFLIRLFCGRIQQIYHVKYEPAAFGGFAVFWIRRIAGRNILVCEIHSICNKNTRTLFKCCITNMPVKRFHLISLMSL